MGDFISTKKEFEKNIIKMNTEQFVSFSKKHTTFIKKDKSGMILEWMVQSYSSIPEFKEKFAFIVNRYKELNPMSIEDILPFACFQLQEESVEILLQLGFDASQRDVVGFVTCPVRILNHHPDLIFPKPLIEKKQAKIFRLLLHYNVNLNFLEKGDHNISLLKIFFNAEKQDQLNWIDSFYEEFNPKQRKEWGAVRLQSLF